MPKREDPTPELNAIMDRAGLTGSMFQRQEPFMKIVLGVRHSLLVELKAFLEEQDRQRASETHIEVSGPTINDII
jgi:hypothetical protein